MQSNPMMEFDGKGVRRVAQTLLNHVRPHTRDDALALLRGRLGGYVDNQSMLQYEVDRYFEKHTDQAA